MTSRLAELYGIEATAELLLELRANRPDGVQLRRRNIETPAQVRELASELRKEFGERFEVAVRHEGGAETPFVRGVQLRSYSPAELSNMVCVERNDGSGDLRFEQDEQKPVALSGGFMRIDRVREIENLIRQEFRVR